MNNFSILSFFAKHKTAANLLMVFLIVFGLLSLERLNRQLFPDLDIEIIVISTIWPGASAEDVDKNIVQKLVPDLRPLSGVKKVKSTSSENLAVLQIEYDFGTNMQNALSDVEAVVNDTDLPEDSEKPRVFKAEFKDEVTNIVLSGPFSIQSLRSQAKIIKEDLLALGVDKIDIGPNPSEEILIEIPETELARLNLSMNDISRIISSSSVDVPAGSFADGALRVRSLGLKEIGKDYAQIEIIVKPDGTRILLGDIAKISETFSDPMVEAYRNGENAINLKVGEEFSFRQETIFFESIESIKNKNYKSIIGNFKIKDKQNNFLQLKPELRIYNQPVIITSEADIKTTLYYDKFLVMNLVKDYEYFNLRYQVKPFMIWIWISTIILVIGGFLSLFQRPYEK